MGKQTWVLTGMSGAGKATAVTALEAAGVPCIDNFPADLLEDFWNREVDRPAVAVVDARQDGALAKFDPSVGLSVLYLDANDETLRLRLSESVRPHPCASAGNLAAAIAAERELLTPLRAAADMVIDTSGLTAKELGSRVVDAVGTAAKPTFMLTVSSFGFKFGPPTDSDWTIDVRILRNPFWDAKLRPLNGTDESVREYVLTGPGSAEFLDRLTDLFQWTLTQAQAKERTAMHIAVGCTGGRHRSVVVAEELARRLQGGSVDVTVRHRDVGVPDTR